MSLTFYLFVVLTLSCCGHASEEETRENWTYTCPGQAVSSACVNNACTIICSDGIKHETSCGDLSSSISSTTNSDGSTTVTVACGDSKVPECFPFCPSDDFPPCFPFCPPGYQFNQQPQPPMPVNPQPQPSMPVNPQPQPSMP